VYFLVRRLYSNVRHIFAYNFNISETSIPLLQKQLSSGGVPNNQSRVVQPKIALNLASSKHKLIYDVIYSGELSITKIV
jgi:hypothetical protein